MENRIVAHFLDGRVLKGSSFDVSPDRPLCHLTTRDQGVVTIRLADVKALFFVKDLVGDPARQDERTVHPADVRGRGAIGLEQQRADPREPGGGDRHPAGAASDREGLTDRPTARAGRGRPPV